jgi:glycosyltransferase involved in cell wall biosynthesis
MKVTIITGCYNRASTLEGAIKSVLSQDYPEIEYIIVDGASKDGSVDLIKRYAVLTASDEFKKKHPHFTLRYISEPDHGMYEAINKGLRMATGDVVGLVHSDDFLYDNHVISDIAKEFERTGADFVYGDGLFVDAKNTDKPVRKWIGGSYSKLKVKLGWLPLHPTCYHRREVIEKVGYYNETYKIAADTDFLIRSLYEHDLKVSYLKRYIIRMRMGGLSTDSSKRKSVWKEDVTIYSNHGFWAVPTKIMKMMWKVPQFIKAKI